MGRRRGAADGLEALANGCCATPRAACLAWRTSKRPRSLPNRTPARAELRVTELGQDILAGDQGGSPTSSHGKGPIRFSPARALTGYFSEAGSSSPRARRRSEKLSRALRAVRSRYPCLGSASAPMRHLEPSVVVLSGWPALRTPWSCRAELGGLEAPRRPAGTVALDKARARWIYPSGTCQITRASSANASARRAVGRTSVPRS